MSGCGVTLNGCQVTIQGRLPKLNAPGHRRTEFVSMATHTIFTLALFASLGLGLATMASAQSDQPTVTMDQAVLKVEQDTGGKVLSADPHHVGRRVEYRIKVLTPEGHVRVMSIPAEANRGPMTSPNFTPSFKNPPGNGPGSREKH